ncbi:MAG TPA: hypothetical protein VEK08_07245 [Planctomycetota bacterium]|nr:hypothetical protein [Planctomycetota bacterium]
MTKARFQFSLLELFVAVNGLAGSFILLNAAVAKFDPQIPTPALWCGLFVASHFALWLIMDRPLSRAASVLLLCGPAFLALFIMAGYWLFGPQS